MENQKIIYKLIREILNADTSTKSYTFVNLANYIDIVIHKNCLIELGILECRIYFISIDDFVLYWNEDA